MYHLDKSQEQHPFKHKSVDCKVVSIGQPMCSVSQTIVFEHFFNCDLLHETKSPISSLLLTIPLFFHVDDAEQFPAQRLYRNTMTLPNLSIQAILREDNRQRLYVRLILWTRRQLQLLNYSLFQKKYMSRTETHHQNQQYPP